MQDILITLLSHSVAVVVGMVAQATGFVPWVIKKLPWTAK